MKIPLCFCATVVAATAAEPAPGTVFYQNAYPEASAVAPVGTPPRWLAVADNELPRVVLFPLEPQSSKVHQPALSVAVSPDYPVDDLEAVTVFPWDPNGDGKPEAVYHVFAGSGSRSKNGKDRPQRDALFALEIDVKAAAEGKATAFPATVEMNTTLRSQMRSLGSENATTPWGPVLRDSLWAAGQKPDAQNAALAGGTAAGYNVEGLTVSKDGQALLLGLRSPLVGGKALLVPLTNPVAALGLGESAPQPAALAAPVLLDLGGRGIRSIEWDAARSVYLISAGACDDSGNFQFFTWGGDSAEAPKPVNTPSAREAAKYSPEGLTPVAGRSSAAAVNDGDAEARYHAGFWIDFGITAKP